MELVLKIMVIPDRIMIDLDRELDDSIEKLRRVNNALRNTFLGTREIPEEVKTDYK